MIIIKIPWRRRKITAPLSHHHSSSSEFWFKLESLLFVIMAISATAVFWMMHIISFIRFIFGAH